MTSPDRGPTPPTDESVEEATRRGLNAPPVLLLLLVPLVGTLIPSFYNRRTPTFIGLPFFYWWQFIWIPIGVACTVTVYLATRGDR